ncbi:Rne/Rng family ribonuclease [Rubrivirga sp. IMCC43871]|uniref:Rne/Rng family ribonuclease n=1 Tax=Rubrivirga sp. IMCC43871 TaxID=3391575 RepID=UPI00398FC41A
MKKQIIINASKDRSRIAIVEDGELVELYVENPDNVRTIGNVYLGRIQKVMPAIRAAFVDVGEKQDCFLHFSDLTDNLPQLVALAGEEVPGLDGPVLSLAPAKRIAEDDSEPDVEDALEVSPGDSADDVEDSRTKSRSGGRSRSRSRGRGRGGRGRGRGRREEEEEQEERRPLRGVIDLSSPAKPRRTPRPTPTPEPEEEPEVVDTPVPVDEAPETDAPDIAEEETPAEEAPKSRRRSRKKAADAPELDADAEAPEPEAETEEKPKSRRRSRSPKPAEGADEADRQPGAAEAAAADPSDNDEADDGDDADEASGEDKPKRRRRRGRRGRGRGKSSEDGGDDAVAPDEDTSKGKGRRRSRSETPADADADGAGEASDRKPSDDDTADADADADDRKPKSRRTRDGGGRSRRGKASDDSSSDKESKPDKASDKGSGRKRLPSKVDLTGGSSRSNLRVIPEHHRDDDDDGDRTKAQEDSRSGVADGKTEAETEGRSRRRSRSEDSDDSGRDRGGRRSSKKTDDDGEGSDDSGRNRGGRRSKKSDEGDSSEDRGGRSRRSSKDEADGESDGRSRRRTRSGDDTKDESESETRESNRSRGGRDSGRDSGRSSRDGDRGGRSSSRDGGRDSGRGGRDTNRQRSKASGRIPSNEELVKRDGKIIVKITKEAISNKGPRVSTDLSLAGRFLVLVPAADYVAVSKKIESAKERRRLRTLATSLKPDGFGVIVRTVAEGRDAKSLDTDLRLLTDKWRKIEAKLKSNPEPPVLLYQDVNMVSSVIRDLFSEDYDRILVDDPKVFSNVQAYVKAVAPQMADKVELHKGRTPVYRSLGIEKQVEEAFSKRVNMRGGGYLFIETTEAMHVVDVNSGRAGRGKSQKQNLIDVNVEAAREVAKQLRLRDLGGIIVIDFIDLKYDRDRKKVTDVLKKAFEKDRAVTKLLPMSDFGLVQITRQRLRPSITANSTDEDGNPLDAADAVAAAGAGEIQRSGAPAYEAYEDDDRDDRSERTDRPERAERPAVASEDATPRALAGRIRGWLDHYRGTVDERYKSRPIVVRVHPLLGTFLRRGLVSPLTRWRLSLRGIVFEVEDDTSIDPLAFDVRDQKSGRSLLKKYAA